MNSHIKTIGALVRNFEQNPKSYQGPVLWTNNVQINTLKGIAKALTVDLLRLNTLRGSKTVF